MSHQLPELPEPDRQQAFFCNKCGSFGNGDGLSHNRADGSACHYQGAPSGPFFTADQMRAYAELALTDQAEEVLRLETLLADKTVEAADLAQKLRLASVKREPLSEEKIETIAKRHESGGFGAVGDKGLTSHWFDPDGLASFARAIEQAHGITATTASSDKETE